jgi:hypothetical protein
MTPHNSRSADLPRIATDSRGGATVYPCTRQPTSRGFGLGAFRGVVLWLNAFIAALKPRTPYVTPASTASYSPTSAVGCRSASPTSQTPTPAETPRLAPAEAIKRRATHERRSRKQAAVYEAKNTSLIQHKGR